MYESKKTPGKRFGSIFAGKKYDEAHTEDGMHSESPEHEAKESPEFEAGEREGAQESERKESDGSEYETNPTNDEHPVATEHGPAHKVIIHHDEASGRHTVTSHHKDGQVHTSAHDHAHKAHEEARALAAVPPAGKEGNEEKDSKWHSGKAQQSPSSEEDGFAMPELS